MILVVSEEPHATRRMLLTATAVKSQGHRLEDVTVDPPLPRGQRVIGGVVVSGREVWRQYLHT